MNFNRLCRSDEVAIYIKRKLYSRPPLQLPLFFHNNNPRIKSKDLAFILFKMKIIQ